MNDRRIMSVQVSKTIQDLACPALDCPDINLLILPSIPAGVRQGHKVLLRDSAQA